MVGTIHEKCTAAVYHLVLSYRHTNKENFGYGWSPPRKLCQVSLWHQDLPWHNSITSRESGFSLTKSSHAKFREAGFL